MRLRYSLFALTLAACSGATSPSGGGYTPPPPGGGGGGGGGLSASVTISGTAYSPSGVTVKAGGTVTWTNTDPVTHSVTSDAAGTFGADLSGTMPDPSGYGTMAGGKFSQTFGSAGTYAYHCNYHSTMHGTVTVSP